VKYHVIYCGHRETATGRRPKFVRSREFPPLNLPVRWPPPPVSCAVQETVSVFVYSVYYSILLFYVLAYKLSVLRTHSFFKVFVCFSNLLFLYILYYRIQHGRSRCFSCKKKSMWKSKCLYYYFSIANSKLLNIFFSLVYWQWSKANDY